MSNINDKVFEILNEREGNKALGYTVGGLTGLVGVGGLAGHYQSKKSEAAKRELDRQDGKLDMYKTDRSGRHILYAVGGSIPILGAVTNVLAAKKRYDLEDELEDRKKHKKHKK